MARHSIAIAATIVAALAARPVIGGPQDPAAPPVADKPRFETEIVVTPERGDTPRHLVPAASVVLDAPALVRVPAVTFGEIVSYLPGFEFRQGQPYAMPSIVSARGFFGGGEADYLTLLVDGVPIADAESGLIDWNQVAASSIRRVEALRGPGASVYGDAAVGGVIQVLTDGAADGGRATVSGGSFATITGDASYSRRGSRAGWLATAAAARTDGFADHSAGHNLHVTTSVDGRAGRGAWRWMLGGHESDKDDPGVRTAEALRVDPFGSDRVWRFDHRQRHGWTSALTLSHPVAGWHSRARGHVTQRDESRVRTVLLAPDVGDRQARDLSATALGGSAEVDRLFNVKQPATLRFGVDLSREHVDTGYRPVDDAGRLGAVAATTSGRRVRTGAFALADWDPASRLRVSAAVRWDRIADDFAGRFATAATNAAWSPRVGVTLALDRDRSLALFSQIGSAFKAPTVDQMFDPRPYPDFRGGTFSIANPRLLPQRALNVEGGIHGGRARLRWSALAYRMRVDDEIDFDVRTFSYANIGQSRHTGVELEGGGAWWPRVQPSVTYAFTRVTASGSDRQLKNIPRHTMSAAVHLDLPARVALFARFRASTGAFLDDQGAYRIQGPRTFDVRVRRPIGRHTVFVDAANLTAHRYQEYGYTLADFSGRVVPYAYPGARRGIRAGVTMAFR